jgi:hypothetical protein
MATHADVRRIALSLSAAEAANPRTFFTEPHYDGFPAVLVRLDAVSVADLEPLITEAWRCQAPVDLTRTKPARASRRPPRRHANIARS